MKKRSAKGRTLRGWTEIRTRGFRHTAGLGNIIVVPGTRPGGKPNGPNWVKVELREVA